MGDDGLSELVIEPAMTFRGLAQANENPPDRGREAGAAAWLRF